MNYDRAFEGTPGGFGWFLIVLAIATIIGGGLKLILALT